MSWQEHREKPQTQLSSRHLEPTRLPDPKRHVLFNKVLMCPHPQTFADRLMSYGSWVMPLLVALSAFGGLSVHIMTSSRWVVLCFTKLTLVMPFCHRLSSVRFHMGNFCVRSGCVLIYPTPH